MKILFLLLSFLLVIKANAQLENSLLWKIQGHGTQNSSYLFGTMHSRDNRIFMLDKELIPSLLSCDIFIPESNPVNENLDLGLEILLLPEGQSMRDYYTKSEYFLIEQMINKYGDFEPRELELFHPAILTFLKKESGPNYLPMILDEYLYHIAEENNKIIYRLETFEQQSKVIMDGAYPKSILEYFTDAPESKARREKMISLYVKSDLKDLMDYAQDSLSSIFEKSVFLDSRNKNWIPKIDSILNRNTAFIAVGASHLPGEEGLISLLRQRGYKVTPVNNEKIKHQKVELNIKWQKYEPEHRAFSALFPGPPELKIKESGNSKATDYKFELKINQRGHVSFSIIEFIEPGIRIPDSDMMKKALLSTINSMIINGKNGKVVSSKSFDGEDYFGRRVLLSLENEGLFIHAKQYILVGKLYMVAVFTNPINQDIPTIEKFLNSFELKKPY